MQYYLIHIITDEHICKQGCYAADAPWVHAESIRTVKAHYGICAADADIISARNLIGSAVMNGFFQGRRLNVIARTSGKGVIY
jgi:hypothetical protein